MRNDSYWYQKESKPFAQQLRRDMTPEEKHLWYDFLKDLPVPVKRQKIILGYVADFYVPSARLVIELDGSQHYSDEGKAYDSVRNDAMEQLGITVLRYSNDDIKKRFNAVCEHILHTIAERKEEK